MRTPVVIALLTSAWCLLLADVVTNQESEEHSKIVGLALPRA